MIECCQLNDFSFYHRIAFDEEYTLALKSFDDGERLPANLLRKRSYKKIFHETDNDLLEKKATKLCCRKSKTHLSER
jgi:hypothetical protein